MKVFDALRVLAFQRRQTLAWERTAIACETIARLLQHEHDLAHPPPRPRKMDIGRLDVKEVNERWAREHADEFASEEAE